MNEGIHLILCFRFVCFVKQVSGPIVKDFKIGKKNLLGFLDPLPVFHGLELLFSSINREILIIRHVILTQ